MPLKSQKCGKCKKDTSTKKTRMIRFGIFADAGRLGPDSRKRKKHFVGYLCVDCAKAKLGLTSKAIVEYP